MSRESEVKGPREEDGSGTQGVPGGSLRREKRLTIRKKLRYCLRCARNNEPWWEWSWGRWKWNAGAIFGLGLCLVIRHDEINVMLGPFAMGGWRG